MSIMDTLFDKYTEMRLSGDTVASVYQALRDEVVSNLTRVERNDLSKKCDQWEKDRTQPDLSKAQQEALKRADLSNITMRITFCPTCDTPNAEGFIKCQVCNEPLAVTHKQSSGTTGMTNQKQGSLFERQSQLVLKVANSSDRLFLQPQISPQGLKLGRTTASSASDVDLTPFGGGDLGVSRYHAVIRFDRVSNRLVIIDNGSTNGTYLNGVKLPPKMESTLSNGDNLRLGRMDFRIKFK